MSRCWGMLAFGAALCMLSAVYALPAAAQTAQTVSPIEQASEDWPEQVRERVGAHDLAGALKIVDARLAVAPDDSDAIGSRAQLLAWSGRHTEAAAEFRRALALSPRDGDYLLGLATLEAEDGHNADALALLNAALQIPPPRADVYSERGRVLAALGRRNEARADFLKARALEPNNISPAEDEATAGLHSLELPPRYELDFTNETDTFNYTGPANAQTAAFVAKPNDRWIFSAEGDSYQRFGAQAQKAIAAAAYRFAGRNWLTAGVGGANSQNVIPRTEAYYEYDRGFTLSETAPLRGIETTYNQHWFWYDGAHVMVLTGTVAADMARDFRWTFSASGARSGFDGTPIAWEPSGYTKLEFPLPHVRTSRFLPDLTFAVGSENYTEVDQIGAFASRTYGGGFRVGLTERQSMNFYFAWQDRNGGNSEGIYGASYGIRF